MDRISGNPQTSLRMIHRLGLGLKLFLFVGWFVCSGLFISYAQSLAPEGKTPEKGAGCELDEQEFLVEGKNSAVLRVHRIFHIYNQEGKKYGSVVMPLYRFEKSRNIKAQVKGFDGRLIRKLEKDDIIEESLFPDYLLYADDRMKHFDLGTTTFPYILEYSYEVEYQSLFFWPDWSPQLKIPVKRSVYTLTIPKDLTFKMYKRNLKIEPTEEEIGGKRQLIFELTQVPPFEPEKNMPPEIDHKMSVLFAPDEFNLAGYRGSTNSWAAFGKWIASLYRNQYMLSSQHYEMIKEVVKDCASTKDTARALYQFLQRKTRYAAISLGIGGWQPHDAESVLGNGYGDCKDLVALFIAMVGVVGIKAYPVLIRTRDQGMVLVDFPSNQFNHVIAYVPVGKETLWLDCTCNYCSFGELPWQDEGCETLVVMDDTSATIRTPVSSADENKINRSIHAKFEPDGSLEVIGTISATGNFESYYRGFLNSATAMERKEWLGRLVGRYAPNYTLLSYNFEKIPDLDVPFALGFTAKLIDYPTKSGNELLINLNLLSRVDADDVPKEKERKYPVDNQFAFTTEDEVTLDFPDDLVTKVVPDEQNIVLSFGSFRTLYNVNTNQITYKRIRVVPQRFIEQADFNEYKAFLDRIYAADHSFVVLTRTE